MIILKKPEKLVEKMAEKGLSCTALANIISCSPATISVIVKGERNPSAKLSKKILEALELTFKEIFSVKL